MKGTAINRAVSTVGIIARTIVETVRGWLFEPIWWGVPVWKVFLGVYALIAILVLVFKVVL